MRMFIIKLPRKIFWYIVAFISLSVNLMVYLYQGQMVVAASTGYSLSKWEKIIIVLQEFYVSGI